MTYSNDIRPRPTFPALGRLYASLEAPVETLLRVVCGLALAVHGWGKVQNPFGAVAMVEGLGFHPGVFWSPLLAGTEFLGGILLAVGFLTRPAAVAATIVLLVTVYFHWIAQSQGYMGAEKSILWAAITAWFAVRGANALSVDGWVGKAI